MSDFAPKAPSLSQIFNQNQLTCRRDQATVFRIGRDGKGKAWLGLEHGDGSVLGYPLWGLDVGQQPRVIKQPSNPTRDNCPDSYRTEGELIEVRWSKAKNFRPVQPDEFGMKRLIYFG